MIEAQLILTILSLVIADDFAYGIINDIIVSNYVWNFKKKIDFQHYLPLLIFFPLQFWLFFLITICVCVLLGIKKNFLSILALFSNNFFFFFFWFLEINFPKIWNLWQLHNLFKVESTLIIVNIWKMIGQFLFSSQILIHEILGWMSLRLNIQWSLIDPQFINTPKVDPHSLFNFSYMEVRLKMHRKFLHKNTAIVKQKRMVTWDY